MTLMTPQEADEAVLAWLRERGPVAVTAKQVAQGTGAARVTVRASVMALADQGLVCLMYDPSDDTYLIRHLHAGPGSCEDSLGAVIQDVHPDW